VFWATLGSLSTMYMVAPEASLTQQLLPLEVGLLMGMGLMYVSKNRETNHPRLFGYEEEKQ